MDSLIPRTFEPELLKLEVLTGLILQKTGQKLGEYRRIGRFGGRKEALCAYEAVSSDDASASDCESFVGEDENDNAQYTITVI